MVEPLTWVEAPARAARRGTSLDVLPVHDVSSEHFVGFNFVPDPCVFPALVPADCYIQIGQGSEKTFGGYGDEIVTEVFGVYAGIECYLNGGISEFEATSGRVLANGEYHAVDGQITALLDSVATVDPVAEVVTAVGTLEQDLAENVPGQGYLFTSALTATRMAAAGLLAEPGLDGALRTYLGTPVIVLTDTTSDAIYATGPINIWRAAPDTVSAPSPTTNRGRALTERLYSIAIECGVWKSSPITS